VTDDDTGWNDVLVGGWSTEVRGAVVRRVERATVGWRGPLVHTLADPEGARDVWTEALHRLVVGAVLAETGADLDDLGSHAAWACYEEVWNALAAAWAQGGRLATVPLDQEPHVVSLLRSAPAHVAAAAGADPSGVQPIPLWLGGRLRVDLEGLWALLDRGDALSPADRVRVETLVERLTGRRR
jgi:hypothetical protein